MISDIASIACDPPLGSVTVVDDASVLFNVAINTGAIEGDVDVRLWHEVAEGWTDLPLSHISTPAHKAVDHIVRFQGILHNSTSTRQVHFTLKIVVNQTTLWVNDIDSQSDGLVIFQASTLPERLDDYLGSVDDRWQVDRVDFEPSSRNRSWVCRSTASGRKGNDSSWTDFSLGRPIRTVKWFALVRHSTPWLGPRQGDGSIRLDKPAVLLSILRSDGAHIVVLPINGIPGILMTIHNDVDGNIVARIRNDTPSSIEAQVVIATGRSLETAISSAVGILKTRLPENVAETENVKTAATDLTDWHDGLSYCTWNGIGRELNEKKILDTLTGLANHGIRVTNLIIDDNWQSLDTGSSSDPFEYQWTNFEANKENFPQGLSHLTKRIRETQPHLRHIAVWHGIFGYWGGISPTGHIAKCYEPVTVDRQEIESYMSGGKVTTVSDTEVNRMYDDFYSFLADSGIDSVKADNQYYPDYISGARDREALIQAYQDAWLAAATKHFEHRAISCMSQTPQILFHSFLNQKNQPPYLVRNSDDFFPDEPSSHTWHIFCNAHNAILTQHLNLLPDWDMFQTAGAFPGMHAAARCLSGGPIYITDVPGQHDKNLIDQMTAPTLGGILHILRPETVGRSLEAYNRPESHRFLRIGSAHKGSSLLGLFNIGEKRRMEIISASAFQPPIADDGPLIVKSHVANRTRLLPNREAFTSIVLAPKEYEIMTAFPVESQAGFRFAVIGLLGKMTGIAAILEAPAATIIKHGVLSIKITLKTTGSIGFWLEGAEQYVQKKLVHAVFHVHGHKGDLHITDCPDSIIAVDLGAVPAADQKGDSTRAFEVEIQVRPL